MQSSSAQSGGHSTLKFDNDSTSRDMVTKRSKRDALSVPLLGRAISSVRYWTIEGCMIGEERRIAVD